MRPNGYTLIELMIVIAIIGILSAIAFPQFSELIDKSHEGVTKGNLGTIRSAIAIYYSGNEGFYPSDDLQSLVPTYLSSLPTAHVPAHD